MYQVSTFYSEKSLCNQKVHLRFLKSNVTYNILIPITFVVLHLGKWDFHYSQGIKIYVRFIKLSPKSDLCFPGINKEFNIS